MAMYLTLEEAADRLGVEYKTVYRLVRQGELPAGKVGRVYRIRSDDLEAYFDKQKRLVGEQSRQGFRGLEAGRGADRSGRTGGDAGFREGGGVHSGEAGRPVLGFDCAACGQRMLSDLSVGGLCLDTGRPICQACWSVRKVRRVNEVGARKGSVGLTGRAGGEQAHGDEGSGDPDARAAASARDMGPQREQSPAQTVEQIREEGGVAVTAEQAMLACRRFLRAFGQRLEGIEALPDPLSGRMLELSQARVKHQTENGDRADKGYCEVSRFDLRTGGWGKPKSRLVLEARTLCDGAALAERGYTDRPAGEAEVFDALEAVAAAAARHECFHALMLGSPTGFSDQAIALVTGESEHAFHDRRVLVCLEDLWAGRTWIDDGDKRALPFLRLLAPKRWEQALSACMQRVRDLIGTRPSLSLEEAAKRSGDVPEMLREAFSQLAQQHEFALDEIEGIGPVISQR